MPRARRPSSPPSLTKIRTPRRLVSITRRLQRGGQRVVFTNGCFDLLHVGHVILLERAKRLGEVLVVAVNSDRSVRGLHKGRGRPIIRQQDRARVIASLASVDYVTIFDEPTPARLITALKPDVLVKGADWSLAHVVGAEAVRRWGGRVARIPLVHGYSTTRLIERIRRAGARKVGP